MWVGLKDTRFAYCVWIALRLANFVLKKFSLKISEETSLLGGLFWSSKFSASHWIKDVFGLGPCRTIPVMKRFVFINNKQKQRIRSLDKNVILIKISNL